ncbi:MAG: UDP-N-acetylmuramoyl-L-alanine--D-glutamate ligase [Candidatus Aminicenantes bacterium]|nr:UDP-N-acetylmuramoyl-L-alanine--D-glutamate ligase [Candidatus Aminicenantes bacterium]
MIEDLKGKRVLVVGLGRTGRDVCRFLLERGARVSVSEKRPRTEIAKGAAALIEQGVRFEAGGHRLGDFLSADLIIPSPGVPPVPEFLAARRKGIPVWSELELAGRFLKGTIVGVTGSCGKSTTVTLTHKILREAGLKAYLAGNIGPPLISFVDRSRPDHVYVTEISSFQLYHAATFRAHVAAFLNISLNHLDWHPDFEDYLASKTRLLLGQRPGDTAVLNRDDRRVWALRRRTEAAVSAFSRRVRVREGCHLLGGRIVFAGKTPMALMAAKEIPLPGAHNLENVMAAALISRALGVSREAVRRSIRTFSGLEHRLERVAAVRGVAFVNDSKATTVRASRVALESLDRKAVLILGGKDKGDDFRLLRKPVKDKARLVVLIGQAREKIKAALQGAAPLAEAGSMRGAVRLAFDAARRGDVVLLAPACASFDMFRNFEERGRAFKSEVRRLVRREEKGR